VDLARHHDVAAAAADREVLEPDPGDRRNRSVIRSWRSESSWIPITRVPAPRPSDAALVNAYDFLMPRARRCLRERHRLPNLVAVDFYRTGDLLAVVGELNRERRVAVAR
jgi:hypothetical protein